MLIEKTIFGETINKIQIAIKRLQQFEPSGGYYLAFSGGKDSIVIKKLADMAGVIYDAHYNNTTIDPPELIYFIKKYHPDVKIDHPVKPFLTELTKRGFPLRHRRWCCSEYKERGGSGRIVITGIRWDESCRRSKRRMLETCYRDKLKQYLNVIIDWTNEEVWEFIHKFNIPYCNLYDKGWSRIGCLFCPFATHKHRIMEAEKYPRYVNAFIKAFEKLYENRKTKGNKSVDRWNSGEEMFNWWLYEDQKKRKNPDQRVMFE